MGSKGLSVFSAVLIAGPYLGAHAQDAERAERLFFQKANGAAARINAVNALHMPPLPPRLYDGNAIPGPNGFAAPPASATTLRIIDTGGLKIDLRIDGMGRSAFATSFLQGVSVGGETRRGGGLVRVSWPMWN